MIKYNLNNINDWNFGEDNIIKVYRNNAVCYYKVTSGDTPTPVQEPCFAVVDDISQYSDTEFEDVFNLADEKWYKLNNLNQYEEYGVYGSGRTITTYEGKLTIDDGDDGGEDYSTHYLSLVAQTDNVTFSYSTATSSNKLQYSIDGGSTWVDLGNNQSTSSINNGEKIMFKASGLTVNTERGIGKIIPSASASVEGNIMSLEYGDNFSGQTTIQNNYQFRKLFSGVTTITSAENMVLPATTVKQQCYSQMFQGCTNLVKTPKTIGSSAMTWSGNYCFSNMFSYCTSLTTVPSGLLPALNLGTQCYWYMFEGCSGLTTAPDLLATTTASQCYQGMFSYCTSLNYITVLTTNNFTMYEWVKNVASSGTFVKNPNATWSSCGQNAYPCGWTVQDYVEPTPIKYEYIYSGGSWVNLGEVSGSTATLPDVSFVLNYNAKNYDATTHSIPQTSGQTKGIDAIQNYGSNTIVDHSADGYISVTGNTRLAISGGTTPMYRTNTETGCTMTIVSKVRTDNVNQSYSILTCRGDTGTNQMNWMWRYPTNGIFLHGSSSYNSVTYYTTTSASPITASVRVSWDGSVKQQINDWTNNGSYSGAFQYGSYSSTVNSNGSLFCDYLTNNGEFWKGDFYWVYMSQEVLTDEQVQQVIAYNEGGGGQTIYPIEYEVMQDPPNHLSFSSMTEAESYECPWVGMEATIDGDKYIFSGDSQSGYEWVKQALPYTELQWIEMPQTSPYCAVQLVDTYSACTNLYYDFEILFNSLADTRIIGFTSNSFLIGYNNNSIYMNINGNRAFTVNSQFTTNTKYHLGLGKRNSSSNNSFDNLGASTTYATFTTSLPATNKPYFGAIIQGSTLYVNGESERIYSIKVYDNEVLVGNYIPVKRNSDNFVTLYDTVSEQFCDTVGGGTMVAGSPV